MTSKEFNRRVSFYADWLQVFELFTTKPVRTFVWKISVFEFSSPSRIFYSVSPFLTPIALAEVADEGTALERYPLLDTVVIERYSLNRFHTDMTYFKSFVSKLSDYQLEVLKSDSRFTNILNIITNVENKN